LSDKVAVNSLENLIVVKDSKNTNIIGKIIYFMIGKALIRDEKISDIVEQCGIGKDLLQSKFSNTHAFKTATKQLELRRRYVDKNGHLNLYRIRILDNAKEADNDKVVRIVREIKKEIISEKKNPMINLGNFIYDKEKDDVTAVLNPVTVKSEITEKDPELDLKKECLEIINLFQMAKGCYNENRLVTFAENFIMDQLDASPINIHGKLFFIPAYKEAELAKLEMFMELIEVENLIKGTITFAALPVMSEEKYIKLYTKEFYTSASDELEILMSRFDHFISKEGTASEKVIKGWIDKYNRLIQKKKGYEDLFKRDLDNLNEDMDLVGMQVRELQSRIQKQQEEKYNEIKQGES
jgi:hypothetical protein